MTTLSPAERYAASRLNQRTPLVQAFRELQRFDLDPFQKAACSSLEAGRSVLVAAPTGAGKTIVAEFAVYQAMQEPSAKVFYTAPMKALSNQKFQSSSRTTARRTSGCSPATPTSTRVRASS